MNAILNLLVIFWYLIAGFNGAPKDYVTQSGCEPAAIWYYNSQEEEWYAWFPVLETLPQEIFELVGYRIDWMYSENGYWIAC